MHRLTLAAFFAAALFAQPTPHKIPPDLRFEVASLTPSPPGGRGGFIHPTEGGARYVANNCSINCMIRVAYRMKPEQIVGGPAWLDSDRYDLDAKAERPSSADELHTMLMNLLVDRMHLQFRLEKREMRMYGLTIDRSGSKLTPHEAENPHDARIDSEQQKFLHMKLTAMAVTMDYLAFWLGDQMDLPVVDMTGLKGGYDFTLSYTRELPPEFPQGAKINGEEPDTSGPSIFDALKLQLGLQLKAQRGQVEVIVIDHADKPSAN